MANQIESVISKLIWRSAKVANPLDAPSNELLFEAWPEQFPEAKRYGISETDAKENSINAAQTYIKSLDQKSIDRILTPTTQISIRVPIDIKDQIVSNATESGMTITRYIIEQCIYAPRSKTPLVGTALEEAEHILTDVVKRMVENQLAKQQSSCEVSDGNS